MGPVELSTLHVVNGWALSLLRRLCLDSTLHLGYHLAFVTQPEIALILRGWGRECRTAEHIYELGQEALFGPNSRLPIAELDPAFPVEKHFPRGEQRRQFPAMLSAARRTLPGDSFAAWLQQLRVYLLLRMMEAAGDGVPREENLYKISVTVREVCETTDHPRRDWLQPLQSCGAGLAEFELQTLMHVRRALQDCVRKDFAKGTDPRSFLRALQCVLNHDPWQSMDSIASDTKPLRREGGSALRAAPSAPIRDSSDQYLGTPIQRHRVKSYQSAATLRRQGEKLRLTALADSLVLPCDWQHCWPHEVSAMRERALELANSAALQDRLGASIVLIAAGCGLSIHDVLSVRITPTTDHRRWVDLEYGCLREQAPRFGRGWRARSLSDHQAAWVTPVGAGWDRALPKCAVVPLRLAHRATPNALSLGDLWAGIEADGAAENWFRQRFSNTPPLHRLSAPSTASVLRGHVLRGSGDLSLTYLLASDERSALPSMCAYGAYNGNEVGTALPPQTSLAATLQPPTLAPNVNAAGSELDADDSRLTAAIQDLLQRVDYAAAGTDWVAHHNLLAALVTVALLSSTGARPVNSPFESLSWFDFKRGLVFVDDKASGPTQGSRLCVLSDVAQALLQQIYLPHLQRLATALASTAPAMSSAINEALACEQDARIPLLFAVRSSKYLSWFEISEVTLRLLCGEDWPLPWNLFRHRMSTQLRRRGVAPDIRDALLGHASRLAEPHGDHSARVPLVDIESARSAINSMQKDIGLTLPSYPIGPMPQQTPDMDTHTGDRRFGAKARALHRESTAQAAEKLARQQIDTALAGRTLEQLTAPELDQIARTMLFRGALPHPMASVRYETWEEFLQQEWRSQGRHSKATHRYQVTPPAQALFEVGVLRAEDELARVTQRLETVLASRSGRREGPVAATLLAAVDMILHSRLAHTAPLISLLRNDQPSFRLVKHLGRHWYEWAFGGKWTDGKPLLRIEVSSWAARCILIALESDRTLSSMPTVPRWLAPILTTPTPTPTDEPDAVQWLTPLLRMRDQQNCLTLPGFLAAYLSGRKLSFALPHADWIRLTRGGAPIEAEGGQVSDPGDSQEDAAAADALRLFRNHRKLGTVSRASALTACRLLFDKITAVLSSRSVEPTRRRLALCSGTPPHTEEQPGRDRKGLTTQDDDATTAEQRTAAWARLSVRPPTADAELDTAHAPPRQATNAEMAGAISRAVAESGFGHGDAPFLLAHFIVHVLSRRPKHGQRDRLRATTALRYWHSLAGPFNDAAADKQFIGADEEDITRFYADIVQAANPISMSGHADSECNSDAASRTLAQLTEFHEFMQDIYGLPAPDWAEISVECKTPVGRPGLLLEAEYLCALSRVMPNSPDLATPAQLRHAFMLMASYRFGLRSSEALGMRRRDWIEAGNATLIAVTHNRWRPLKTAASRRVVPLREPLTPLEVRLVNAIKDRWQQGHELDESRPFLPDVSRQNFGRLKVTASSALLEVIKEVSRNPKSTVHMLRHSFAMRLTADLLERPLEPTRPVSTHQGEAQRRLFAGHTSLDRRALWAVARALGHSNVTTTLLSYINCLYLWLDSPVSTAATPSINLKAGAISTNHAALTKVVDLDRIEIETGYLHSLSEPDMTVRPVKQQPPLARFRGGLEYLRRVLIGKPETGLATACRIDELLGYQIGASLAKASQRVALGATRYAGYAVVGGTTPRRLQLHLTRLDQRNSATHPPPKASIDWLDTIGASRQILGFCDEHFKVMKSFMDWLDLSGKDLVLVHPRAATKALLNDIRVAGLSEILVDVDQVPITPARHAKAFQVDVARVGDRGVVHPQRAALITKPSGKIETSHELISLWIIWNVCVGWTTTGSNSRVVTRL